MDSLGITDHGGLYGAIDFYRMALSEGVKPIIGCEMYVAPGSRHSRSPSEKTPFHATVLAKDNTGYANLVKLVSKAHLEGFYYKPRIDRELIESYKEGLIFLSGCPSGEVPSLIAQGRMDEARAAAGVVRGDVPRLPSGAHAARRRAGASHCQRRTHGPPPRSLHPDRRNQRLSLRQA